MVPYIVALVFLIVIILWQVYSMTESFADATTTGEKLSSLISRLKKVEENASKESFNLTVTDEDIRSALGLPNIPDIPLPDISTSQKFAEFIKSTQPRYEGLLAQIQKGDFDATGLASIEQNDIPMVEKIVAFVESTYNKYASKESSTNTTPTDTTSPPMPSSTESTKSGLMVNLEDIWGAIGPLYSEEKKKELLDDVSLDSELDASENGVEVKGAEKEVQVLKPQEVKVTCAPPVKADKSSNEYNKELEDRIAKNIVKQVKDELIVKRQTQGPVDDMSPYASCDLDTQTESISQGYELQQAKPTITQYPNMSEYIRKDNIPCAKCNLSS